MKKAKIFPYVLAAIVALLVFGLSLYLFCPALNVHNVDLWILFDVVFLVFLVVLKLAKGRGASSWVTTEWNVDAKGRSKKTLKLRPGLFIAPFVLAALILILSIIGSTFFNATAYSKILTVTESDFSTDLSESVGTDSIALMDTASAQMLGDREIGALSDVVSQFDVSDAYTQIDFSGKPIKVAPLEYAGFFKWINNRSSGIKGYVSVNPVTMSASFQKSEGMKYVPSAFFSEDACRYLWSKYPTLMLDNLHFEIDESGKPYYVASIIEKSIGLFGGTTVSGCVVLDPVSGETEKYDAASIPQWVDVVFYGDLICTQYNWHGMYQNGFWNSVFAKKGCKQVTSYYSGTEETEEDTTPISDYGYVAKGGDIWIYTGITSVNGDSSNIGFLLANERTGESRYYPIAGADEKSAMAAAEGEVQEKGYRASFPSLINIDGFPTYIMVLKDSGGLVKLYATVNVEQYNIVTTAATQADCIQAYKAALGIDRDETVDETKEKTITIASIKYIDIEGNTYIYFIDTENGIFKAKTSANEEMLLLKEGDQIQISYSGNTIAQWAKIGNP